MVQVLPRYCPQCSAPTQTDMQRCAVCDLSVEALLHHADAHPCETNDDYEAVLQNALAPASRRFQQDEEALLAEDQHGCPDGFALPPRFPPASPFPLASDEENALNPQERPHHASAPQEPPVLSSQPLSPLPDAPGQGSDLVSSPDHLAILSVEALLRGADSKQSETSEYHDVASQSALAPTPRIFQQEDEVVLSDSQHGSHASDENDAVLQSILAPTPRIFQQEDEVVLSDSQHGYQASGEPTQPPCISPPALLPPEPGERNTPADRWRAGMVFIILVVLVLFAASGGYMAFSGHLSKRNSSQALLKTTSRNSAVNARATATAKAANINPYVSGGTLIFSDPLQAANSNWDQNTDCAFKDGSYHVTAITIQSCTLNANVTLTNFVLEVKVTLLQGNVGGFFFRENKLYNRSNAYLLDFDSKGNYQLWNYSTSRQDKLIDYGFSSNLSTGYNQMNIIALVVQGSSITLYVNGQMVKHFIDRTYSSGGLSLISSEYSPHTGVSEAAYRDLRLWQL